MRIGGDRIVQCLSSRLALLFVPARFLPFLGQGPIFLERRVGGRVRGEYRIQLRQPEQFFEVVRPTPLRVLAIQKDRAGGLNVLHDARLQPAFDGVTSHVVGTGEPTPGQ